jgi:hypothetical protein
MPIVTRTTTKQPHGPSSLMTLERMAKRGVGIEKLSATKKLLGKPSTQDMSKFRTVFFGRKGKGKLALSLKVEEITPEDRILSAIFPDKWVHIASEPLAHTKSDSDKATRLIYILDLANETFGDKKRAREFLLRRHPKLKATPLAKLETEWGGREVENILHAMIYGLPY